MWQITAIVAAFAFLSGAVATHKLEAWQRVGDALAKSEANRETERLAAIARSKQYETFAQKIDAANRAALVARSDADSVRGSLRAISAAPAEARPPRH